MVCLFETSEERMLGRTLVVQGLSTVTYLQRIHKKDQFKVKMLRHILKEYIRRINLKYNCCDRVPQTGELEERDIRLDVQVGQAILDANRIFLFDKQIQDDHQMQCIVLKMEMEIYPLETLRKCLRWKKKMWRHFECAGAAKLGFAAIRPQRR